MDSWAGCLPDVKAQVPEQGTEKGPLAETIYRHLAEFFKKSLVQVKQDVRIYLDTSIRDIDFNIYHQIEKQLELHKMAEELARVVPRAHWTEAMMSTALSQKNPSKAILQRLIDIGTTLRDLIDYMTKLEFWPGLQYCCEGFPVMMVQNIPKFIEVGEGKFTISCRAAGVPAPKYQWFFAKLTDSSVRALPGETKPTLTIKDARMLWNGRVCCSICNSKNNIFTRMCDIKPVTIDSDSRPLPPPRPRLLAKSKVALLIGNGKYKTQKDLPAPKNDIRKIGQRLQQLNFHTLICKDLNKAPMEKIIQFFINLMIEGVYGVLYFAGHGFETAEGSFLLPSDINVEFGPSQSVSITEVHKRVLEKNPALCLIMLDICRVRRGASNAVPAIVSVKANTATVLIYATNSNMKAFECGKGDAALSIFVNHLLPILDQDLSVRHMVAKITDSVANDQSAVNKQQNVETKMTLASEVGLHDKIDYSGSTQIYNQSLLQWERVNKTPHLMKASCEELGIMMEVHYSYIYSNALVVHVACLKQNDAVAYKAEARICNIATPVVTLTVAELVRPRQQWPKEFRNNKCMCVYQHEIEGLENLDMELNVTFLINGQSLQGHHYEKKITCNLGRPLLSTLGLPYSNFQSVLTSGGSLPDMQSLPTHLFNSAGSSEIYGQAPPHPSSLPPNLQLAFQGTQFHGMVPYNLVNSQPSSDMSNSLESRNNPQ